MVTVITYSTNFQKNLMCPVAAINIFSQRAALQAHGQYAGC